MKQKRSTMGSSSSRSSNCNYVNCARTREVAEARTRATFGSCLLGGVWTGFERSQAVWTPTPTTEVKKTATGGTSKEGKALWRHAMINQRTKTTKRKRTRQCCHRLLRLFRFPTISSGSGKAAVNHLTGQQQRPQHWMQQRRACRRRQQHHHPLRPRRRRRRRRRRKYLHLWTSHHHQRAASPQSVVVLLLRHQTEGTPVHWTGRLRPPPHTRREARQRRLPGCRWTRGARK
mmetsp:Transcript_69731/g.119752  ORF Transcript_69731/g.119752 Transcript_69731/m.119752 type:complete len:232 (+) Transcript_69731:198-893(+)